jgi:hypothetical protein
MVLVALVLARRDGAQLQATGLLRAALVLVLQLRWYRPANELYQQMA